MSTGIEGRPATVSNGNWAQDLLALGGSSVAKAAWAAEAASRTRLAMSATTKVTAAAAGQARLPSAVVEYMAAAECRGGVAGAAAERADAGKAAE